MTTGVDNTIVGGLECDAVTTGSYNVAVGRSALGANTIANSNTSIGWNSLGDNVDGSKNVAIGHQSLRNLDPASAADTFNVALGYHSGLSVSTGTQNTIIGGSAGDALTTGANNIIIGYNAAASAVDVSNEITLGDANISAFRCADQSIAALSDGRDKSEVEESPYGLEFINKLKPVKFTWDFRPEHMSEAKQGKSRVGFIAQDLQEAMPNNDNDILDLVYEISEDRLEAKYGNLIPVMAKAIQELSAEVKELKKQING